MFSNLTDFKNFLKTSTPEDILNNFIENQNLVCCNQKDFVNFKGLVTQSFSGVEDVIIMGSGNYGYSLNPRNDFSLFHEGSDIDVAIISYKEFHDTWDELRHYHRSKWYELGDFKKTQLKRNGENVYSGFISPKWIPETKNKLRFRFIDTIAKMPGHIFGYRDINMLFFKSKEELKDYYKRGITIAKGKL